MLTDEDLKNRFEQNNYFKNGFTDKFEFMDSLSEFSFEFP